MALKLSERGAAPSSRAHVVEEAAEPRVGSTDAHHSTHAKGGGMPPYAMPRCASMAPRSRLIAVAPESGYWLRLT